MLENCTVLIPLPKKGYGSIRANPTEIHEANSGNERIVFSRETGQFRSVFLGV